MKKTQNHEQTLIECPECGYKNVFTQPYPYHAGFANQGFLYNEDGNLTLIWSSFDSAYEALIGKKHPWVLNENEMLKLEMSLLPAPTGGLWKFTNPARCLECKKPISEPMTKNIYYLIYKGSINADYHNDKKVSLADYIKQKG
jgi:hypothetical protein